ncbi:MAG TPA: hypothetical protein VNO22_16740 [Planctomycetota bacterium]|jgi:peptidoglycan/LPS O-acetylase OafA/YrhL|nr:hypothetical protein [Planctomycetota bacterium]
MDRGRGAAAWAAGAATYLAVLAAAVEAAGVTPPQGAVLAFPAGLAAHDALAPRKPPAPWSAALGALGILGGLAVQLAVMDLFSAAPYGVAAPLGGAAAALFAFLTRRRGAFAEVEPRS